MGDEEYLQLFRKYKGGGSRIFDKTGQGSRIFAAVYEVERWGMRNICSYSENIEVGDQEYLIK